MSSTSEISYSIRLQLKARSESVKSVTINGKSVTWELLENSIEMPHIEIVTESGYSFSIDVEWEGKSPEQFSYASFYAEGSEFQLNLKDATILKVFDPQKIFGGLQNTSQALKANLQGELGGRTAFVQLQQGEMSWWQPVTFELRKAVEVMPDKYQPANYLIFAVKNNTGRKLEGVVMLNGFRQNISIPSRSDSPRIRIPAKYLVPGSNLIRIKIDKESYAENVVNWNMVSQPGSKYESLDLSGKFNDRIINIFKEQYYSPRSPYPTLSIPLQGIGDWCSFKETEEIDDSGLLKLAGTSGAIQSPQGIPFSVSGKAGSNILFTSKWDNYPDSASLNLSGKARHIYLLMAGSGHHMQSRMTNGIVKMEYSDGTTDELLLVSPDNWWPVEQDFYEDGYAFRVDAARPPRLYLKTGEWHADSYDTWSKNKTRKIDGGAASVLDLPLNPLKELRKLTLVTRTNDVVIGLMAATLQR